MDFSQLHQINQLASQIVGAFREMPLQDAFDLSRQFNELVLNHFEVS